MSYSRRAVLTGLGVTLLAGCTGEGVSPAGSDRVAGGSSGSLSATVGGETIQIDVLTDTVESVSVIDPEGRLWTERTVSAGVTRVDVRLDERYTPGVYRIVGASDGETVAETRVEIVPDLRIVEFDVGQNQPERMPESFGVSRDSQALVTVENTGTGPEYISKLLFDGDVPNPTATVETGPDRLTGIHGDGDWFLLPAGEEVTLFSDTLPFLTTVSRTIDCSVAVDGIARVRLVPVAGRDPVSQEFQVSYQPAGSGCEITIGDI
jgi:hypothetical protein